MDKVKQSTPELEKLSDLIGRARIGMLTTREADGTLRSRPLATLQMDATPDLWFFTSASSPKIHDIESRPEVNVAYADSSGDDFVSVSGTAELVRDRAKMRELWTPWVKPWFPKGVDDPDLVLLRVSVREAEYWDAPATAGQRPYGLGKAVMTGQTDALGENRKIRAPGAGTH